MAIKVFIPTPLRSYTDKKDTVELDGFTVEEVLNNLTSKFGQIRQHLYAENGNLQNYINIYVNDEDIRYLAKEKTAVKETDTISIIPSIAGGTAPKSAPVPSPGRVRSCRRTTSAPSFSSHEA